MMINTLRRVAALLLAFTSTAKADGPFGIEMGQQPPPSCKAQSRFNFLCAEVPKKHDGFENYLLQSTPETGVCVIFAIGKTVSTSSDGFALKSETDKLVEQLNEGYGIGERYDFIAAKSIWSKPHEWMMAVSVKDRSYQFGWSINRPIQLKNNVSAILLTTIASGPSVGYVTLRYELKNFDKCRPIIDRPNRDAL